MRLGGAQVASLQFFVRTLQWMQDDETSIVLTPQVNSACHFNASWRLHPSWMSTCSLPGCVFNFTTEMLCRRKLQPQQQLIRSYAAFLHESLTASSTSWRFIHIH